MSVVNLVWKGNSVKEQADEKIRDGMTVTLLETQQYAQQPGVTPRETSTLANSITIQEPVGSNGSYEGRVGSFGNVRYAFYVEVGTSKMAGRHYMRKSGDAVFPRLAENIGAIG